MSARRRRSLLAKLKRASRPISGTDLARELGCSRQVVVQDVAVLRAAGQRIQATPHGYQMERAAARAAEAVLAVRHDRAQTSDELNALVDLGLEVVDVIVEHPIYGEMRGLVHVSSRDEVASFLGRLERSRASLLSAVTGGLHLHTVRGVRPALITKARAELRRRGFLIER